MAQVKDVLVGRYELLDVLGRGGMGVVYRARDRRLDRVVAVKVLPLDSAENPTSVARFEREALAAAALTHRNIVAVFDSGRDEGTRFIVMERVSGSSLAQVVVERGPLGVEEAVRICTQVASALAAAHEAGIVHRDIKPANLMLDEHGTVKVLDFGIVRLAGGASLTQAATVLGSAAYLAPELCRGARADHRSDVYALGCVLYELLTGRPPFTAEQPAAILSQQISSSPSRPEQLNPAIPPRLAGVMLAMLAKDPEDRPQRASELVTGLPATLAGRAAAHGSGATAPTLPLAGTAPTLPLARPDGEPAAPTMVMRRGFSTALAGRRLGIAAAAAAVTLVLALIGLEAASGGGAGQSPARAATHQSSANLTSRRQHAATTTASVSTPLVTPTTPPAPPKHHDHGHGPADQHGSGDVHGPGGALGPAVPSAKKPHGSHDLPPGKAGKLKQDVQNQQ